MIHSPPPNGSSGKSAIWLLALAAIMVVGIVYFFGREKKIEVVAPTVADVAGESGMAPAKGVQATGGKTIETVPITNELLASAGFSKIEAQTATADGNYQPATYFWVGPHLTGPAGTVDTRNLLMVSQVAMPDTVHSLFAYASTSVSVPLSGTTGNEWPLKNHGDSRVALNFLKNGLYVVIIGPTPANIEKLAGLISEKIQ